MADEVADQELLWRRIHESHDLGDRPSSAAFLDPEMSVDREHLVSGEEPRHRVTQADGVGVGEFTAAVPRAPAAPGPPEVRDVVQPYRGRYDGSRKVDQKYDRILSSGRKTRSDEGRHPGA